MGTAVRVLIVDDSADDAELITHELVAGGFSPQVARVETGPDMLHLLRAQTWDIVIADYSLPTFGGPRALELLKQSGLDVPFILVSGVVSELVAVELMKAGANDLVLKQNLARLSHAVWRELRDAETRRERRRAEQNLGFLRGATVLLAESLDYEMTLSRVSRLAVPYLADWCVVDVIDRQGEVRRRARSHVEPGGEARLADLEQRFPGHATSQRTTMDVIATGDPQLVAEMSNDLLRELCPDVELAACLKGLGMQSLICVPLIARTRIIGAITLCLGSRERRYDRGDLSVAEELARRAAVAIDNARLYREAHEAVQQREEFLSVASHELRAPLTSLQLTVQGLATGNIARSPDNLTRTLAIAERQVDRLTRLVDELFDVARLQVGNARSELMWEDFDLGSAVRDVVDRLGESISRAHCPVQVSTRAPVVGHWDRSKLDQIVTNLLSNALKFGAGRPIEIEVTASNGKARLVVSDHGIGIPADRLPLIFERFERAVSPRAYGGLGLGLYIVRSSLAMMAGTVQVESHMGEGSTFTVELPLQRVMS